MTDPSAIFATIIGVVALGIWVESQPRVGQFGAVGIIILGAILGALGVVPRSSEAYTLVVQYFVPLSIPLLLFNADLRRIWRESGRVFVAFVGAAVATVIGALLASNFLSDIDSRSDWIGVMTAGFIGGNANSAAVASAMGKASEPFMGVVIASVFAVQLPFMALLLIMPSIPWLWRLFSPNEPHDIGFTAEQLADEAKGISAKSLALSLALSAVICAVSELLTRLTEYGPTKYLSITTLSVAFASLLPRQAEKLHGHYELGQILIYMFFAVIGIQINIGHAIASGADLMLFCAIVLVTHLVLLSFFGRLIRLNGPELAIASNTCILGPATAAAMAISRGWHNLITPGILCGVLGYAIANIVGITLAGIL